ncbi:hypothetical protein Tco_0846511 [Tanacetum coccineum]
MDIPAISCHSCNANVESANHVFFECDIATDMWKLVFRWCDIPLFQASSWDSFNDWIISWHASKEKKHRFYVITTSVLWWLWRYRNSVTFNSQPLRKSDLFDNVRFSSFSWLHNRDHMKLSWNDWLIFGKFLFFEKEESTTLSSGRLCISTKSHQLISETVQVDIKNESFEEVDHVSESNDEQPIDDFEILQTKLNNMDEQAFDNELGTEGDKKDGENRYSIDSPKKKMEEDTNFNSTNSETKDNSSDLSRPPGFEFMKKSFSSSSNCSTSFARRRKNDIKGFSLLSELNQIIDVGSSLGYDVRGCKKTLNKMIKGIGIHMVDK